MRRGRPPEDRFPRGATLVAALAVGIGAGCRTDSQFIQSSLASAGVKPGAGTGSVAASRKAPPRNTGGAGGARAGASSNATGSPGSGGAPRPLDETVAFVCNYWEDDDDDGIMDYPDEFRGIGKKFSTADRIAICFQTRVTRPYRRSFKLRDGDRSLVLERTKDLNGSAVLKMTVLQYEPGQLDPGSYEAAWHINDEPSRSARFEIAEE